MTYVSCETKERCGCGRAGAVGADWSRAPPGQQTRCSFYTALTPPILCTLSAPRTALSARASMLPVTPAYRKYTFDAPYMNALRRNVR
ncbi:hypothetical protein EXIGLDRAFT_726335 [Exidia glandulosa HHB12029]|uniref:Uncharacterized protein n=1 Tax=Exidia glandulosa HHB12029 TaxID=1314781 RepID=A0A165DSD1_EXIGL|nr:hypothetical protein EXIGLDRAFT_726335 [Exidia glandulosa HHB12029]